MTASIETLLNLACIKHTGIPLPCDADCVREWSYTLDANGKKRGKHNAFLGTLLHNPLASGLGQYPIEHAIKRSLITDSIKLVFGNCDITYDQICAVMRGAEDTAYVFTPAEKTALSLIRNTFRQREYQRIRHHNGQRTAIKFAERQLDLSYGVRDITNEEQDVIYILLLGNPALRRVLKDLCDAYDTKSEKAKIKKLSKSARYHGQLDKGDRGDRFTHKDHGINENYSGTYRACWGENSDGTLRRFRDIEIRYGECPMKRDLWAQYFYAVMSHKLQNNIRQSHLNRSKQNVNWWRHVKEQGLLEDTHDDFTKEYYEDKAQKHQTKLIQSIMNL
jgi:hypothetical protein